MRTVSGGNTIGERSGTVSGRDLWTVGPGNRRRSWSSEPISRTGDNLRRPALEERIRSEVFVRACAGNQRAAIDKGTLRGCVGKMPLDFILYISLGEGASCDNVVGAGAEDDAIPDTDAIRAMRQALQSSFPFTFSEVFGALLYTRTSAIR